MTDTTEKLVEIRRRIIERYGSTEAPDFGAVKRLARQMPYRSLISELESKFVLEDITDPNSDVSLVYDVDVSGTIPLFRLSLSLVGPYAYIEYFRDPLNSPALESVYKLLEGFRIEVLDQKVLDSRLSMKMNYTDPEDVCYFNALFSDIRPPWRQGVYDSDSNSE
jgi:hypothetical protein